MVRFDLVQDGTTRVVTSILALAAASYYYKSSIWQPISVLPQNRINITTVRRHPPF